MAIVNLPTGGSVDVTVDATLSSPAAQPFLEISATNKFDWRVKVGKPGTVGAPTVPAMSAKFTLKPNGAPNGTMFGVRQVAFFRGATSFHSGMGSVDGSILGASTAINFTWNPDSVLQANGAATSAPALPFFQSREIVIANGAAADIVLSDTPGGTERLVRANMVTSTRNFLRLFTSSSDFVTYAVAVLPDSTHFALAGFFWRHRYRAELTWDAAGTPTLNPTGDATFDTKMDRAAILSVAKTDKLERNDLLPNDLIGFKFNDSLTTCLIKDAAATPLRPSAPKDDVVFDAANYVITHSLREQL